MTIGQRLKVFIDKLYGTQRSFAAEVGLSAPALNRYISGQVSPQIDVLIKFQKKGLSIDWLLTGTGTMYLDIFYDEAPEDTTEDLQLTDSPHKRIKNWIIENYGTVDNFCKELKINKRVLDSFLLDAEIPDLKIIDILKNAGCDLNLLKSVAGLKSVEFTKNSNINSHLSKHEIKELIKSEIQQFINE